MIICYILAAVHIVTPPGSVCATASLVSVTNVTRTVFVIAYLIRIYTIELPW